MPSSINVSVKVTRYPSVQFLRDDDLGSALVQLGDNPVCVKRLVCDQPVELDALDPGRHADGVVALAWQQDDPDEIALTLGGHARGCRFARSKGPLQ